VTFNYDHPSSNHAAPAAPAAPAASAAPTPDAPAAPGEPRTFNYDKTNQPKPEGLPADELPEAVREKRDASERRMYSAQKIFESALPIDESWPEMNKALGHELREAVADAEFSDPQVRDFNKIARDLTEPVSDEQRAGWEKEAHAELRQQYGAQADKALEAAQRWVAAQSPVVGWYLAVTGLGSHPAFVRAVVEKAFRR
jgi:hypothetical protein